MRTQLLRRGFFRRLGINGGGGWSQTTFESGAIANNGFLSRTILPPSQHGSGGVFGFQFGHNWQWGPIVGGLEIDFDGASIKDTTTFFSPFNPRIAVTQEAKVDELASARGRFGYLIFPNWLLFGTAGIGWGHTRLTATETSGVNFLSTTSNTDLFGWVAGAGAEWKFAPSWLLRASNGCTTTLAGTTTPVYSLKTTRLMLTILTPGPQLMLSAPL